MDQNGCFSDTAAKIDCGIKRESRGFSVHCFHDLHMSVSTKRVQLVSCQSSFTFTSSLVNHSSLLLWVRSAATFLAAVPCRTTSSASIPTLSGRSDTLQSTGMTAHYSAAPASLHHILWKIAISLTVPLCRTTSSASTPTHSGRSATVQSTGMTAHYNAAPAPGCVPRASSGSLSWMAALCAWTA